jgi:hypothetical protein
MSQARGYSLVSHLKSALWPNFHGEVLFMVYGITAYYDASLKEEVHDRPLVLVGIASTTTQWEAFEAKWAAILAEKDIEYFDAAACSAWKGDYKTWNRDHGIRDPFLVSLARLIGEVAVCKVVVAEMLPADFAAVNQLYVMDKDDLWPSPYPLLAHWSMRATHLALEQSPFVTPGYRLAHLLEYGDKGQGAIRKLIEREPDVPMAIAQKWNKATNDKIHAFAASDLFACYARQAIELQRKGVRDKKMPAVVRELSKIPLHSVRFEQSNLIKLCESAPQLYPKRAQ